MKNDKLGVKKVKKVRKSGRETLTLHVKKCKKRSKIGFHAHFRFHAQKKKHWLTSPQIWLLDIFLGHEVLSFFFAWYLSQVEAQVIFLGAPLKRKSRGPPKKLGAPHLGAPLKNLGAP